MKNWNKEEINILQQYYKKEGAKYCYIKLNKSRTLYAIRRKAKKLNLSSNNNHKKYKYSQEQFKKVVLQSFSLSEILEKLDLRKAGGNYKTIKKYIQKYNIDTTHFNVEKEKKKRLKKYRKLRKIPLEEILVKHSTYTWTSKLKERLYNEGLKEKKCELCGQGEEWRGKKMSLILDHINGIHDDNELKNLRIVCPNCNATLDTHCGKNIN